MIGIHAIGVYIPRTRVPVVDLPEFRQLGPAEAAAARKLGCEAVSVDAERGDVDLAVMGAREALDRAGLDPEDLGAILYLPSRAPRYLLSSEATAVQQQLGAKRAFALAVGDLGCANVSGAIVVGRGLLAADPGLGPVLVCGGSKPVGPSRYRTGVSFLGDSGLGLILGRGGPNVIEGLRLATDGKYWDLYKVDYRGTQPEAYREDVSEARYAFELSIATRNTFRRLNRELLAECGAGAAETRYVMPNLSVPAFEFNEDALGIRFLDSGYDNLPRYGHFGGTDIVLNYQTSLETGEIEPGDRVLLMNNSPAACWSSILVTA